MFKISTRLFLQFTLHYYANILGDPQGRSGISPSFQCTEWRLQVVQSWLHQPISCCCFLLHNLEKKEKCSLCLRSPMIGSPLETFLHYESCSLLPWFLFAFKISTPFIMSKTYGEIVWWEKGRRLAGLDYPNNKK